MNIRRAMEFIVSSDVRSAPRMDLIKARLDRLWKKPARYRRWMARNDRKLSALIQASRGNTLEHRRFMKEMRALGKRMDYWLRGGGNGRGPNGRKR